MKRTLHITLLFCMAIAVIAGCRKPNNNRTTDINTGPISTGGQPPTFPGGTQPSLNQLFKELRYIPEVKCVTAGILQVVTFSKGTRLTFYPNSFKNAAGATITSGTVCIEMIEMYKPGDMIANRATTVTKNGDILRSGGQVYINATKDGQPVYANKYGIAFRQPAASTQPMNLYYGSRNTDSTLTWDVADSTLPGTTAAGTNADSLYRYYHFDSCTTFRWTNCDRLAGIPGSYTTIKIVMPNEMHNNLTCGVFLVFPEINAVAQASLYTPADKSFNLLSYIATVGVKVTIVAFSNIEGVYYYCELKDQIVTDGMIVHPDMVKQSLTYIQSKIAELE